MGLEDRDWYREDYRAKEKKYGSDFSGSSKQKKASDRAEPKQERKRAEPRREYAEKTVRSTVFTSEGAYSTMSLGSVPGDPLLMNVLGVCPNCHDCFPVKVLKSQLYRYDYTCPRCGHVVSIHSKKPRSVAAKAAKVFLALLLIVAAIAIVGFLGNYLHDRVFPAITVWFLETFGAYL